jgi:hypothetical protein
MRQDLVIVADSYSTLGTKECYFTDQPRELFHFSDSGGIFGEPKKHLLSTEEFREFGLLIVIGEDADEANQVLGRVSLPDGFVIFSSKVGTVVLNLISHAYQHRPYPVIYFPTSLKEADAGRLTNLFDASQNPEVIRTLDSNSASMILAELTSRACLPLALERSGNRYILQTLYSATTELPVEALPLQRSGNSVHTEKRILLGGIHITGFAIHFPNEALAVAFLGRLGLPPDGTPIDATPQTGAKDTLTSQVQITGSIKGVPYQDWVCDADLAAGGLTLLHPDSGQPRVHFDFEDNDLAIEGTNESFLISDSQGTALRISGTSEPFHLAILGNHALRIAANRSANRGPYIAATGSGKATRIEVAPDGLSLDIGRNASLLPCTPECLPRLEWKDSRPCLHLGDLELSAQLPMLEGISAAALGPSMRAKVQTAFQECLSSLVGLEGNYFAYCGLGRLMEAHLSIMSALAAHPGPSVASLTTRYEQDLFLAFMTQNTGNLVLAFETTLNYLPTFAATQDAEFFSGVAQDGLLRTRNVEQAYRHALAPLAGLLPHLQKLDAITSRLHYLRKALAKKEGLSKFVPLGLSLAASFVTPFALIGAAQQGASLFARSESQSAMEQGSVEEAFVGVAGEWDYLIQILLPYASYRLCQEIYPVALGETALLQEAYTKAGAEARRAIESRVAHRLACLTTFLDFPSDLDPTLTRGRVVTQLFSLQSQSEALGLRHY